MNITMFHTVLNKGSNLFAGSLTAAQKPALKSVQEKAERQKNAAGQIQFWENQKENLKSMECSTLEDITKKLEKFHLYEDEIAAVKMQYNQEQMRHIMDEAREIGEKIAEGAEKFEPKTAEERREEMAEEALGTDEEKGALTESMEELSQLTQELTEEVTETDPQEEFLQKNLEGKNSLSDLISESFLAQEQFLPQSDKYKGIDVLI